MVLHGSTMDIYIGETAITSVLQGFYKFPAVSVLVRYIQSFNTCVFSLLFAASSEVLDVYVYYYKSVMKLGA